MPENNSKKPEMVELLVMLKSEYDEDVVTAIAESVQAQVVEIRTLFDKKLVGLIALSAQEATEALSKIQGDKRVEIAQINRTYRHC